MNKSPISPSIPDSWPCGKIGVVGLVGRPNTGKSTFLNTLLGYHLCAVSPCPQTTRHHWRGIYSDQESQIVFVDTPGVHEGKTWLNKKMMENLERSIEGVDIIFCLADPTRYPGEEDALVCKYLTLVKKNVWLLLNKADLFTPKQQETMVSFYQGRLGELCQKQKTLCALNRDEVLSVINELKTILPVGPFLYDPEHITDAFLRDIAAELIREATFHLLKEEVPHSIAIEIEQWKEKSEQIDIHAVIHVERESQKGIVIGKNGQMLKKIRENSSQLLAEILDQQRIQLHLYVKVSPDWRNQKNFVNRLLSLSNSTK